MRVKGNLNLKDLAGINEILIRKKEMAEKVGKYIYRIKSEDGMFYIRTLDTLTQVMGLCRKFRGRFRIVKDAEKKFSALKSSVQLSLLWVSFTRYLNWAFLMYFENESLIAKILQERQNYVWLMLKDYDFEAAGGWISIKHTLETLRKEHEIIWMTEEGDDAKLAIWGIETVIFKELLEVFDFVEINRETTKFRLSESGRKAIRASVPLGWGIIDFVGTS